MLGALAALAEERRLQLWVSMEQTMGCAVGACLGCAIPVHGAARYARVCTEGPVFDAKEIVWTFQ
jgi:dihydroorotate dehydrogenase electron transfer subunit